MSPDYFHLLINHEYWANTQLCDALTTHSVIPPEAKKIFDHILGAQHTWIMRIKGEDPLLAIWPDLDSTTWKDTICKQRDMLLELSSNPERLRGLITYKNSRGDEFTNPVHELLTHLALHSQYHRGQVVIYIKETVTSPVTDMIAYLRL